MAIIKPNNNTISAITALPAAISTGKVLQVVSTSKNRYIILKALSGNNSSTTLVYLVLHLVYYSSI